MSSPDIDLAYRPKSYFWPPSVQTHLMSRVKGAERRAALKHWIKEGRLDVVPPYLSQSALSEPDRASIGRIHPAFMGGEYLPDMTSDEVSIARITLASVTQDVVSVYARAGKTRIRYRIVDEYMGESLLQPTRRTSTRPLSLGQLESFLGRAWPLNELLHSNFAEGGYDVDEMLSFIRAESDFYDRLGDLYEVKIRTFAAARRNERLAATQMSR
jgi:hypothetical protein